MLIRKKIQYKVEWLGLQCLYFFIPILPRYCAHGLSRLLGSLAFLVDSYGRNIALENLNLIYGSEKSQKEIRKLARDSYRIFSQTVVDQLWSKRLNARNVETYCDIQIEDEEATENTKKTGAIWVTPHYGNFEWVALIMGFRDYKFKVVAQDFNNPSLTETYKKNREVSGHEVIAQRGALRKLLKSLKNGGHAAFLTDLTIPPSKPATIIECFGRKTCVTALHAELMKRTGLPIIPVICIPKPDGTYLIRILKALKFEPDATNQTIAQAYWNVFEPFIREYPEPWLWMYKHWRYLPTGEEDSYPSYSEPNEKFNEVYERAGF